MHAGTAHESGPGVDFRSTRRAAEFVVAGTFTQHEPVLATSVASGQHPASVQQHDFELATWAPAAQQSQLGQTHDEQQQADFAVVESLSAEAPTASRPSAAIVRNANRRDMEPSPGNGLSRDAPRPGPTRRAGRSEHAIGTDRRGRIDFAPGEADGGPQRSRQSRRRRRRRGRDVNPGPAQHRKWRVRRKMGGPLTTDPSWASGRDEAGRGVRTVVARRTTLGGTTFRSTRAAALPDASTGGGVDGAAGAQQQLATEGATSGTGRGPRSPLAQHAGITPQHEREAACRAASIAGRSSTRRGSSEDNVANPARMARTPRIARRLTAWNLDIVGSLEGKAHIDLTS